LRLNFQIRWKRLAAFPANATRTRTISAFARTRRIRDHRTSRRANTRANERARAAAGQAANDCTSAATDQRARELTIFTIGLTTRKRECSNRQGHRQQFAHYKSPNAAISRMINFVHPPALDFVQTRADAPASIIERYFGSNVAE
jgi:hypothetical protein